MGRDEGLMPSTRSRLGTLDPPLTSLCSKRTVARVCAVCMRHWKGIGLARESARGGMLRGLMQRPALRNMHTVAVANRTRQEGGDTTGTVDEHRHSTELHAHGRTRGAAW